MPPIFWTQKQDIGPRPRTSHAIAHDTSRGRAVLFGGDPGGGPLGDTWAWDGNLWTQIADTGPTARHGAAMVHESGLSRVLLFGGASGGVRFGDTWALVGSDWTQLEDTGPGPRAGHAIGYDAARQRAVLFGGRTGSDVLADTWEWDGVEWTQREDTGPSARAGHAMAYDVAGGRVVLFGGAGADGNGLDDTWAWNGTTWTQIADTGPERRVASALVADGGVLLFGGISSVDPGLAPGDRRVFGDSWRLEGDLWTKVQDIGPSPRWGHGLALTGDAASIVLFGGATTFAPTEDPALAAGLLGDTWHVPGAWTQPDPNPGSTDIALSSVTVQPDVVVGAGAVVDVYVSLTGSVAEPVTLLIGMYHDDGTGTGFQPIDPPGFSYQTPITVPAGTANWQFQMVRENYSIPTGAYAIAVAVDNGTPMQGGFFTVQ